MIANLKPYAAYKDSGLPWVGAVPRHWTVVPNRGLFRRRKVLVGASHRSYQLLSLTKSGVIVRDISTGKGKFSADMGTSQEVRSGDLVFCLFDIPETPRTVGLSRHHGMITGAYTVFDCTKPQLAEYIELFYRAMDDRKLLSPLYSGLRNTIQVERFLGTKTPQPPFEEQALIVRFLDWANGRLERTIRAKRRVIALLTEQKQAIIHRAVTRGLDPAVPLKPSGIPWLGDIPQHWQVMPVKRTCSLVRDGTHLPPPRTVTGFPLLSVRNIVNGCLVRRPDDSLISKADFEQLNSSFVLQKNDVVMAIVGATLGKVAVVEDIGPFQIQRSVAILRPRLKIMFYDFLATFLRSPKLQQHLWQSVAFSAQPGIYLGFVANIPVPVPPTIGEQISICKGLQHELTPVNTAISRLEREIELLCEYRTRLVADVVTGKLDVRQVAARLPQDEVVPVSEPDGLAEDEDTDSDEVTELEA